MALDSKVFNLFFIRTGMMLAATICLAVLIGDQWTKEWIRLNFFYGEKRPIIDGFFDLVYVRNPGAAWGILGGQNLALILISFVVLILLIIYRRSFIRSNVLHKVMFGLMVGGVIGNLIDRIRFAWVTDFLDFQFGSYHYPSFNVADSAICISVFIYMTVSLWSEKNKIKSATDH